MASVTCPFQAVGGSVLVPGLIFCLWMLWEIPLRYLPGLQRTKKVGNRYSIAAICNPTTSRCQTLQARSLTDE